MSDVTVLPVDEVKTRNFSGLLPAMAFAVAIRLLILLVGLISIRTAPPGSVPQFNVLHPWIAWDAINYYTIAASGYAPYHPGEPYHTGGLFDLVAYFPLVPIVGRAISWFMPLDAAMVALSNICSLIGFGFLYDWARRLTDSKIGRASCREWM